MEEELDDIEDGKLDWRVAMAGGALHKKNIEHAEQHSDRCEADGKARTHS
jgi:DNA topoisomerase IA